MIASRPTTRRPLQSGTPRGFLEVDDRTVAGTMAFGAEKTAVIQRFYDRTLTQFARRHGRYYRYGVGERIGEGFLLA